MNIRAVTAVGALSLCAASANASVFALATNGSDLYRVNTDTAAVESFDLGDEIVSQAVLSGGEIIAFSNSEGPDGFEVYELTDPVGTPSLSLITTRETQSPSQTEADGTIYAVRNGDFFTVDPVSYELSLVASLGLSGDARIAGGTAYDATTDTFYYVARDGNLYTIDGFDTATPTPVLVGSTGVDTFNHGMEFFDGVLYAAIQNSAGTTLSVGTIDTASGAFSSIADVATDGTASTSIAIVIPTPGALALFGAAGVVATRRRR